MVKSIVLGRGLPEDAMTSDLFGWMGIPPEDSLTESEQEVRDAWETRQREKKLQLQRGDLRKGIPLL